MSFKTLSLREQLENIKSNESQAKRIKNKPSKLDNFMEELSKLAEGEVHEQIEEIHEQEEHDKTLFLTIDDFSNKPNPFDPVNYHIVIRDSDGWIRFNHGSKTASSVRGAFLSIMRSKEYTDCKLEYTIIQHNEDYNSKSSGKIEFTEVFDLLKEKL